MIGDDVDPCIGTAQQSSQCAHTLRRIVDAVPEDILHRQAALVSKVIAAQHCHDIAYREGFLYRHQRLTLLVIGRVDADGYMHRGLVKQSPQSGDIAYGGDGDALGTPSQAPRG